MEQGNKERIEKAFRNKYPDARYIIKKVSTIENIVGVDDEKSYIIEFIDNEIKHPKTMELIVKEYQINLSI